MADINPTLGGSANRKGLINKIRVWLQKNTFLWVENVLRLSESGKDENYPKVNFFSSEYHETS